MKGRCIKDMSIKKGSAYINYLAVSLIFISLYNNDNVSLRYLGTFFIGTIFLFSIVNIVKSQVKGTEFYINRLMIKPMIYSQLIIFSYIITFLMDVKVYNLKPLFQVILLLIYLFSLVNIDFSKTRYRILSFALLSILIMCYLPMLMGHGQTLTGYKSVFTTTTFLGIFSLFLFELSILAYIGSRNKIFIIYSILFINLINKAQTRASLLALIIIIFTYIILSYKKIRIITWKLIKYGTVFFLISLVVIYPILDKFSWYPELSSIIYELTGKILMSGRNTIWADAIDLIKQAPLLGRGFSASSKFNISPHNSYLGIGLQSGFLGITIIATFINSIFNIMYKYRKDMISKICTSFFIGNLILCAFEVMLFQGQLVLSLLLWTIAGIGISKAMRLREEEDGIQ